MKLLKLNLNKVVIPGKVGIKCLYFSKDAGSSIKAFEDDKIQKIVCLVFLLLCFVFDAHACTVCFKGDPNQTANVAARSGVVMMLGVVAGVLGLFGCFFLSIVKKSTTHIGKAK